MLKPIRGVTYPKFQVTCKKRNRTLLEKQFGEHKIEQNRKDRVRLQSDFGLFMCSCFHKCSDRASAWKERISIYEHAQESRAASRRYLEQATFVIFLYILMLPTSGTSPTHLSSPFFLSLKRVFEDLNKETLAQQNTKATPMRHRLLLSRSM